MNKFLKNISLLVILLITLNTLLYLVSKKVYIKNYQECSLNFKSYLLSDSHGESLGNFTEKYNVFNFSAASDSYLDLSRKINYLIKNTSVDTIYLAVDDHTLSPYREVSNNMDRSDFYCTRSDYKNYFEYLKSKYLKRYIVFFQPKALIVIKSFLTSEIKALIRSTKKNHFENDEDEWASLTDAERINNSKSRFENQFNAEQTSKILSNSLLEIITLCKKNNITLIGMKMPLTNEYLNILQNKSYGADELFRANGLIVLDFKKTFQDQDRYFKNQDHLNKLGSYNFVELWLNKH